MRQSIICAANNSPPSSRGNIKLHITCSAANLALHLLCRHKSHQLLDDKSCHTCQNYAAASTDGNSSLGKHFNERLLPTVATSSGSTEVRCTGSLAIIASYTVVSAPLITTAPHPFESPHISGNPLQPPRVVRSICLHFV